MGEKWGDAEKLEFAKANRMACFECGLFDIDDRGVVVTSLGDCPDDGCAECPLTTGDKMVRCRISAEELQRMLEFRWR